MLTRRGTLLFFVGILFLLCFHLTRSFPTKHPKGSTARLRNSVSSEAHAQTTPKEGQGDPHEQNQLQTILSGPHHHKRGFTQQQQHRSGRVLPQPQPEEETKPFILDLKNFPDLANADIGSQNPNIQVTIEVVDDPQMEVEIDLAKEVNKDWPSSSSTSSSSSSTSSSSSSTVDWLGGKKLFWPLFWGYTDADSAEDGTVPATEEEDYTLEYDSGEPLPSGLGSVGSEWDGQWNEGWQPTQGYYETGEQDEWTAWTPCSVTCGHGNQTRTRSCGDFCTSTESRSCELDLCPDDMNTVSNLFPFEMENGTEPFGTDVDSCEKWLNCKSEFLQRYLQQAFTELPSCPCSYPASAPHAAVSILDESQDRTFRWQDASGPKERLDIYKPSAQMCLRSGLSGEGTTLAAQHCCYDDLGQLITRGKGAGTPNLISTEFSPELHFKVDILPWILCKGDWSRFHAVRPPNNGLRCPENPHEDIFINELEEAREY